MTAGIKTVLYPVTDIAASKAVFGALLGVAPTMDQPYYVQFDLPGQEIGLDPKGRDKGMTGPVTYYHVEDIKATVKQLVDAGAQEQQAITDVGGGRLIATVTDPDGNVIGVLQP